MKVKKLVVDYDYDFDLYGVVSAVKDYKLAWQINSSMDMSLVRQEDYSVFNAKQEVAIVNYLQSTENSEFRLFKNRGFSEAASSAYMVFEMKHFDYFILIKGIIHNFTTDELIGALRSVQGVQLINKVDIEGLKSKDHFVY